MREIDVLRLPPKKRVEVKGPDVYNLKDEILIKPGVLLLADGAIVNYQSEGRNHDQQ